MLRGLTELVLSIGGLYRLPQVVVTNQHEFKGMIYVKLLLVMCDFQELLTYLLKKM